MARLAQRDAFTDAERAEIAGKVCKVAGNTWEYTTKSGEVVTRLHHTDIVRRLPFPSRSFILSSGGWGTMVTRARINNALPSQYGVQSWPDGWYVVDTTSGQRAPFYDGMRVPECFAPGEAPRNATIVADRVQLTKQIRRYAQIDLPLPQPGAGDCWVCMTHREPPAAHHYMGQARGARVKDQRPDCLRSHLDERYVHGTLIINALRFAGYSEPHIGSLFQAQDNERNRWYRDCVRRAVRKYMRLKLGLPR